jgi:hypothetical protein
MPTKPPTRTPSTIGDDAVRAKTGKTLSEWFATLDKAQAKRMSHQEIVAYLVKHHQVGSWWRQMVAVTYEQDRGLRAKHQKPDGFQISVSKTIRAPVDELFAAWKDEQVRREWCLDPAWEIRKSTLNKSLRITWVDGHSRIDVDFYAKGDGKSQVVVQHGKLANSRVATRQKNYWSKSLDVLKTWLEK